MSKWIAILFFFLAGCTANPIYMRAYSGSPMPKEKVATIKPAAFLKIHRIDSMTELEINPSGPGLYVTEYEIELPAGDHSLEVSYYDGMRKSLFRQQVNVTLLPNRRYLIRPVENEMRWKPVLIDVSDRPQCWTLKVMSGTKGCD